MQPLPGDRQSEGRGYSQPGEDILLNPSFREFSLHYSLAVLLARVGKPTDKDVVEGSVGTVSRRILAPLLGRRFFSVEELNGGATARAGGRCSRNRSAPRFFLRIGT